MLLERGLKLKETVGLLTVNIAVNGEKHSLEVKPWQPLSLLLRDQLGLTGTKVSCEQGECGACTVLLDGKAVNSCLVLAAELNESSVITIEGLAKFGELDYLQQAFLEAGAVQCGFCTPGMIMSAKALLITNANPDDFAIRQALAGNYCRCTGYHRIVEAVKLASQKSTAK